MEGADRHGVLPLLARRARAEGVSWVVEGAETTVGKARARQAVLGLEAAHAFAILADQGIRAASFKGFATGRRFYPEEATRPLSDVDVLVAGADFDAAVRELEQAGYRRRGDSERPTTVPTADSWILVTPRGTFLDLHRAIARPRVFPVDHDAILRRSVPGALPGERWLDVADELHLACLHHQKHSYRVLLVQILDAAILATASPDWDRLCADSRAFRTTRALWVSLQWVRSIDRVRVPEEVLGALRPDALRARDQGRNPSHGSRSRRVGLALPSAAGAGLRAHHALDRPGARRRKLAQPPCGGRGPIAIGCPREGSKCGSRSWL